MNIVTATDDKGDYYLIGLTNDESYAKVSPEDYEYINYWAWQQNKGYATRSQWTAGCNTSTCIRMHLEIAKRAGIWEEGKLIDHKNRIKLDCRRSNLRVANKSQNAANMETCKGTSVYKGVFYQEGWNAQIKVNYKCMRLGRYNSEEVAARVYDLAAIENFGEYAHTNFPVEEYTGMNLKDYKTSYKAKKLASAYRGVTQQKRKNGTSLWLAVIERLGKRQSVGYYFTQELAARAYDLGKINFLGIWEGLNYPAEDYPNETYLGMDVETLKAEHGTKEGRNRNGILLA